MSLKMKGAVLDELVKRLRWGGYRQGQTALRRLGEDGAPDMFCCLGVLCEMAVEDGVVMREAPETREVGVSYLYVSEGTVDSSYLPDVVVDWAGIVSDIEKETDLGEYHYEQRGQWGESHGQALAVMNDEGMPFPDIADWLEENVERV